MAKTSRESRRSNTYLFQVPVGKKGKDRKAVCIYSRERRKQDISRDAGKER